MKDSKLFSLWSILYLAKSQVLNVEPRMAKKQSVGDSVIMLAYIWLSQMKIKLPLPLAWRAQGSIDIPLLTTVDKQRSIKEQSRQGLCWSKHSVAYLLSPESFTLATFVHMKPVRWPYSHTEFWSGKTYLPRDWKACARGIACQG